MALYDDTGKPCTDCGSGTYVEYNHGIACRYCGQPQKGRTVTTKGKTNE